MLHLPIYDTPAAYAPRTTHHAFSLVELSIVLVILGLLVGGVLAGKSLIRASELRSVIKEYQQLYTATQAFKEKYFALPGDMNNATEFWGQAAATGAACREFSSTDKKTCNGNGDGKILYISLSYEEYRSLQHLANAGLLVGEYDGRNDMMTSKLGSGSNTWLPGHMGNYAGNASYGFAGWYGNILSIMDNTYASNLLDASEAYNIDSKLDDGKPAVGKVVFTGVLTDCTDTNLPANLAATYLLSQTQRKCGLTFRNQF